MPPSTFDLDQWIDQLITHCEPLAETQVQNLCEYLKDILVQECNVQPCNAPVTLCGDIHGQFFDLLELFRIAGPIPETKYIFMGDLVDRGHHSVETLLLLLCYKARYPDQIVLIRGNHETRQVTQSYGFYDECIRKYGTANVWRYCTEVFDYFTIAAVVDNCVFCVHGGLSPDLATLDEIRVLTRNEEVPNSGPFCDLLWSDPDDGVDSWGRSKRGAGWLFGYKPTDLFCHVNGIELICRAHQLMLEGYSYKFKDKNLLTVWSAPNYCYRCNNVAAVLSLNEHLDRELRLFKCVPEPNSGHNDTKYFL